MKICDTLRKWQNGNLDKTQETYYQDLGMETEIQRLNLKNFKNQTKTKTSCK